MPTAYVLINADLGAEEELVKELKNIEHVSEVYVVYGVYDVVTTVDASQTEEVKETTPWKISRLEKQRSTLTMIVVET